MLRPPRDEVLATASRVFGNRGYAAATMREIAEGAGLHPSSLYYYFRSKEEILGAIVGEVNHLTVDHLREVDAAGGPVDVQLYRVVRFDVQVLCRLPYDIGEVLRLGALDEPQFVQYWDDRRALHDGVEALVTSGASAGLFRPVDARLAALTLLSNDEAVRNWYGRPQLDDGRYPPVEIAEFLADQALRTVLAEPGRLDAVRNAALAAER